MLVLIVDDDETLRRTIQKVLSRAPHSFTMLSAANADEALHLVREHDFDCVVTDIAMPRMDGVCFLHALQMGPRRVPVIALTGLADKRVHRAGFDKVLDKPIEVSELADWITRLVKESLQ